MKTSEAIICLIILISFGLGLYFYSSVPNLIVSHWGADGQANGYMSKFWGLFLLPIISVLIFLLLTFIPKIDPLKNNAKKFKRHYDNFVLVLFVFLFYVYTLTLFWNLGYRFNMTQAIIPAFSLLFYYSGSLMENAKQNWFIGIRTPWTLSSEKVWQKTHKLAAKLFKACGILSLLGLLFADQAIFFVLGPVLFTFAYTMVYSYREFKKEIKKKA